VLFRAIASAVSPGVNARVTTIFFPFNKIPPRSDSKGNSGNRFLCMVEFDQKAGVTDVHAPDC